MSIAVHQNNNQVTLSQIKGEITTSRMLVSDSDYFDLLDLFKSQLSLPENHVTLIINFLKEWKQTVEGESKSCRILTSSQDGTSKIFNIIFIKKQNQIDFSTQRVEGIKSDPNLLLIEHKAAHGEVTKLLEEPSFALISEGSLMNGENADDKLNYFQKILIMKVMSEAL